MGPGRQPGGGTGPDGGLAWGAGGGSVLTSDPPGWWDSGKTDATEEAGRSSADAPRGPEVVAG
ncbi:hypothetical protein A6V29_03600 [Blastococcus sp. CCUG 61487]|nr:hypothetical protein A6V29_03600 [Blastococcus sp. CCUG 61487]